MLATVVVIVLLGGTDDTEDDTVVDDGVVGWVTTVLGTAVEESLSSQTVFLLPLRLLSRPLNKRENHINECSLSLKD